MTRDRSTPAQAATAMLGVIAAAAWGYGVLLLAAGILGGTLLGGTLGQMATIGAFVLAVLAATYGTVSAIGALGVWQGRAWGRPLGFAVAGVAILGAVVARMSDGWHDALWAAIGLGVGVIASLLADRPGRAGSG